MSGVRLTDAEWRVLSRKLDLSKCIVGKTVGAAIAEKPKGQPRFQQRSEGDKFKSDREREYAVILEQERKEGTIARWAYESLGLRIDDGTGKSCVWWPDFAVWLPDGKLEFRETKGKGKFAVRSTARVKFLAARRLFPEHVFSMWQRIGAGWEQIL